MTSTPRILLVTPEATYLPHSVRGTYHCLNDRDGGLADMTAALVQALFQLGVDIHVALPHYRLIFSRHAAHNTHAPQCAVCDQVPMERVHLVQDRAFYYLDQARPAGAAERIKIALAFQRDVINNIIPRVQPDLIHCNDWMTALIPAVARYWGIAALFTLHTLHGEYCSLNQVEERGIDTTPIWQSLYYERFPATRPGSHNRVDLLTSAVFAAHFINAASPTFLNEIVEGRHQTVHDALRREIALKAESGCARGILYAPDRSFGPTKDPALAMTYDAASHVRGKQANKKALQRLLKLHPDPGAALFFWPAPLRADNAGCRLLADILYQIVHRYWDRPLQMVFVADGPFKRHIKAVVDFHLLHQRVALVDFDEAVARLAYGAADFILAPSRFEPCGLIQMIGTLYGTLPVAYDTGGAHETVAPINVSRNRGNGFLFEVFDQTGLAWAIGQAMDFHSLDRRTRAGQISRVMGESARRFSHRVAARRYVELYEQMLQRPLLPLHEGESSAPLTKQYPSGSAEPVVSAA